MTKWSESAELSPAGERRRNEMRRVLGRAAVLHRKRRRRRRAARWSAGFVLLIGAGAWSVYALKPAGSSPKPAGQTAQIGLAPVAQPPPAREPRADVVVVGNDAATIRAQRVRTRIDINAVSISDDELLTTLAQMGRRTGIARIDGRAILTEPVTDEELERSSQRDVQQDR